jgi:quercetin dioxygenase-like cupin family protein
MQSFRGTKGITFIGVVLAVLTLGAGIGYAASTVVTDTNVVRLRIIQSEFDNGFDSTWHTHPGPVIVQVQEGQLRITQGSCHPTVLNRGDTYIEVPLVPVRAVAKGHVKWTTSQILPNTVGSPAQTPANDPCPQNKESDD